MPNVNDSYFDGLYKEIWRHIIPPVLTERETAFLISNFNLGKNSKVLDLMCGFGRHALELARKGINVTAVDNLSDYVEELKVRSIEESLPIEVVQADVLDFSPAIGYQLAICMGNSLNFYNKKDTTQILTKTARSILENGHVLINTWSLAEIVLPVFKEKSSSTVNGILCENESQFLFHPTRIRTKTIMISNTMKEEKIAVDYIYSINEMEDILDSCGFILKNIYSIPPKKTFSIGDPRAYIIAVKK
jgi:2-polyprenyl-3-methyl-5-hydroxy-6-metoxy-1,4-benzoquinol methylase